MKIKKIRLKNGYKRFYDLTIDLGDQPKKIIALIGPNGCGKSSVLDGMLFHANAYGRIGGKEPKDYNYHSMNKRPNISFQDVEIQFDVGDYNQAVTDRRVTGRENTIFSFRSPYRYNSDLKVSESRATPSIWLNNYGATSSTDIDDKMEQNYRRLNIKYNDYLNETDCKPSEAKSKIISDLNGSLRQCLDLEISSIGNIEASQGTLYFKKADHPSEFEFNVLSSGEKEIVDILLDLYLRKDSFNETIFLLDEPELHINSSIQKKLLIEINKMVGDSCQIWITTHSIGFLRALKEDLKNSCQIIEFTADLNLAASPKILTPIKPSNAKWREVFSVALDDLVHLVSPNRIIYCEGKDRPARGGAEAGFDARVYNAIFSEKYSDTIFVSSGGNTELDQRSEVAISILTKVLPTIEILVLKDRDMASGKITTLNDRQIYLDTNPPNHRILNRWEIENYLFDKEVLKKYCAQSLLAFNESNYDAFVTDVANQNLKDETGRIKNFCGLITSINPEQFKLSLSRCITEDMSIYKELEGCIF